MPTFEPIIPKKNPFARFTRVEQKIMTELRDFQTDALNELQRYPPPPGSSTYRRTGNLGRLWTKDGPKKDGRDIVAIVGNATPYAVWVQGPSGGSGPRQRDSFAGYWKGVTAVAEAKWPRYQNRILRILKTGG